MGEKSIGGDHVGSRGPEPHFLLVWGSTCTWAPHFCLLKYAFFKLKCTPIYCDNNTLFRTTGDDIIKPSVHFLAYLLNTYYLILTNNTMFITVVVSPFDPVNL
jgi:hypothetical protein